MPERVHDRAEPVTEELVGDRARFHRAGGDGPGEGGIDILDIDLELHRRPAQPRRTDRPEIGILVRQHDHRVAKLDLGMPDPPVRRIDETEQFPRTKGGDIEINRFAGILDTDIGQD